MNIPIAASEEFLTSAAHDVVDGRQLADQTEQHAVLGEQGVDKQSALGVFPGGMVNAANAAAAVLKF